MSARNSQSLRDLQIAILDAVGPENWRELGITAATLTLTAGGVPRLTLDISNFAADLKTKPVELRRLFDLVPIEQPAPAPAAPPALNLETMTARAYQRIASEVSNLAVHASVQTACAFTLARQAAGQRQLAHLKEHRAARHQRGAVLPQLQAVLASIAGALAIALVLGAFGPALDALPDHRGEWLQAEQELQQSGALARFEAEARERCTRLGSENSGYIQVDGGAIVCTTKRGHVLAQKGRP